MDWDLLWTLHDGTLDDAEAERIRAAVVLPVPRMSMPPTEEEIAALEAAQTAQPDGFDAAVDDARRQLADVPAGSLIELHLHGGATPGAEVRMRARAPFEDDDQFRIPDEHGDDFEAKAHSAIAGQ